MEVLAYSYQLSIRLLLLIILLFAVQYSHSSTGYLSTLPKSVSFKLLINSHLVIMLFCLDEKYWWYSLICWSCGPFTASLVFACDVKDTSSIVVCIKSSHFKRLKVTDFHEAGSQIDTQLLSLLKSPINRTNRRSVGAWPSKGLRAPD